MKNLVMLLGILAISYSTHAETIKLNYIDYSNQKHSMELKREKGKVTLTLNDFTNPAIELVQVEDETGTVEGAYESGVLKQDVRSKSNSSYAIYSLHLGLNEGKSAAENKRNIDELRAGLNKMSQDKSIQFSGDQICPKDSVGIIALTIKDTFIFPFCVTPLKD